MADVKQFKLPDVGEGLTEADIVSWKVKPGDSVTVNQVIVEIETAKSLVELPCPFEGVVTELLVPEGQSVDVGTPIIAVDVSGEAGCGGAWAARCCPGWHNAIRNSTGDPRRSACGGPRAFAARGGRAREPGIEGSPAPKIERQAVLVGYGVKLGTTTRRPREGEESGRWVRGWTGSGRTRESAGCGGERGVGAGGERGPADGQAAGAEAGQGSGGGSGGADRERAQGTITREDVQAAAAGPAAEARGRHVGPGAAMAGGEERIPVRGVRKHTALAVSSSAFTAPHVTEFLQIDVTETMNAVRRLRELPEFEGWRPSPLLLVAKALLVAVATAPDDQLVVGRGGPGDRGQALREPGHRRRHRPGPAGAQHQERPRAVPARAGPRAVGTGHHGAGREDPARRPGPRHDHDHQRGRVRRGHRHAHPDPRRDRRSSRSARSRRRPGSTRARWPCAR